MNPDINPQPTPQTQPAPQVNAPIAEPGNQPLQSISGGGSVNLPNDFTIVNYAVTAFIFVAMIYSITTNRKLLNKLYE